MRTLPKADMEIVETQGAERGPESKFFTQVSAFMLYLFGTQLRI